MSCTVLVADLFQKASPAMLGSPVTFKGLTKEGIEWLPHTCGRGSAGVTGGNEGDYVCQLLQWILTGCTSLQDISIEQILYHPLEEGGGLTKVHLGERERSEVGKDAVWYMNCFKSINLTAKFYAHEHTTDQRVSILTGIGIFERSFPIQFFMISHRLSLWLGFGRMVLRRTWSVGFTFSKKLGTGPTGSCKERWVWSSRGEAWES